MDRMPLRNHLAELQRRFKVSLLFFGIGLVIAFILKQPLLDIVRHPHEWAMKKMNLASTVYVFRYQDNFIVQLKVCIVFGFIFAFPFILFQLLKFIRPGLKAAEKKTYLFLYLPVLLLLFVAGGAFSYFFLIPYGLHFLLTFGTQAGLFPLISFADYVSLFVMLVLLCALTFELPLIMLLISNMGLVTSADFRKYRRFAILGSVLLAAILTPPDPVTQILMAIPLVILYEAGIWCSALSSRAQSARDLSLP